VEIDNTLYPIAKAWEIKNIPIERSIGFDVGNYLIKDKLNDAWL